MIKIITPDQSLTFKKITSGTTMRKINNFNK